MAKSTRKTNTKTKRQPAKKSRLSSSRVKKPSVKTTSKKIKSKVKKPAKVSSKSKAVKKPASNKKTSATKRVQKNNTRKLSIRLGRRTSLVLTFQLSKKKAPARRKPSKDKAKKEVSFEKNLILSTLFIGVGVLGSIYATAQIFGSPLGQKTDTASAQGLVLQPISSQESEEFLEESVPTHLKIPAVNIDTKITVAGKNSDGTLEVPENYDVAGWYKFGPTPGEEGPAVIAGHVNRDHGPGVFGSLYTVKKGQVIEIKREDGKTVLFKVDTVKQFPQNKDFPTEAVYGNIDHAGLRLITCAGDFNYVSRHYSENTVVFASYWKIKDKDTTKS